MGGKYHFLSSMLVGYSIKLFAIVLLYLYMLCENKRRDRDAATATLSIATTKEKTTEELTRNTKISVVFEGKIEADAIERGMLVMLPSPAKTSFLFFLFSCFLFHLIDFV